MAHGATLPPGVSFAVLGQFSIVLLLSRLLLPERLFECVFDASFLVVGYGRTLE